MHSFDDSYGYSGGSIRRYEYIQVYVRRESGPVTDSLTDFGQRNRRQDSADKQKIAVIDEGLLGRFEVFTIARDGRLSTTIFLYLDDLNPTCWRTCIAPHKTGKHAQVQQNSQHKDSGTGKQRTELSHQNGTLQDTKRKNMTDMTHH